MPFEIVRNDITNMHVDAIVNTANPHPVIGSGTDFMVHAKAGPGLLSARKSIGAMERGEACITPAFDLDARYVIHTVGPVWIDGTHGEEQVLRRCYENALKLAVKKRCKSIAFPLISAGNYGFPKDRALQAAISVFSAFLLENEMQIYLVVFNKQVFRLSEKLFHRVASYIDQNYVDRCEADGHRNREAFPMPPLEKSIPEEEWAEARTIFDAMPAPQMPAKTAPKPPASVETSSRAMSLADMLKKEDAGFSETLAALIKKSGRKKSDIYKRANLTKQHFSKILNTRDYKPTKSTALALAIALELDLEQTRDLIGRAGFALTNSSKFDLIVMYYIGIGNYNVVEINIALYEFDQALLGAKE